MQKEPLVLKLLKVPFIIIGFVTLSTYVASALPLHLYILLTTGVITRSTSSTRHLLLWFPRWLASLGAILVAVAETAILPSVLYWWTKDRGESLALLVSSLVFVTLSSRDW